MDGVRNMSKYDAMIALNKKVSEEKINKANKQIWKIIDEGEKVTIPKLMAKTGLSRGFFYKNPVVHKEFARAVRQQAGMVDPKRYIGDMVLKSRIEVLEQQVRELRKENESLKKEKNKLEKALDRKEVNIIKNL